MNTKTRFWRIYPALYQSLQAIVQITVGLLYLGSILFCLAVVYFINFYHSGVNDAIEKVKSMVPIEALYFIVPIIATILLIVNLLDKFNTSKKLPLRKFALFDW